MAITLFVGDVGEYLAKLAKTHNPAAFLIDHSNYCEFLKNIPKSQVTVYTSLGDLPNDLTIFNKIVSCATTIIYSPPTAWSDCKTLDLDKISNSIQGLTEFLLHINNKINKNVINLNLSQYNDQPYLALEDIRKSNDPQLWIVGCSFSHGVGVDANKRYGHILGKKLNLSVSYLTNGGTSICWAADQLLRSDIQKGDIVVWGLTNEYRFARWSDIAEELIHFTSVSYPEQIIKTTFSKSTINKLLVDKNNFSSAIQAVNQVNNFCKKIKAKLLIIGLMQTDALTMHLNKLTTYFPYYNVNSLDVIDVGSDNMHPGPLQHQLYADFCQSALKQLNYI